MEFATTSASLEYPFDAILYDDGRSASIYLKFNSVQSAYLVKEMAAAAQPPVNFAYCHRSNCPKCNLQQRVDTEAYVLCKKR